MFPDTIEENSRNFVVIGLTVMKLFRFLVRRAGEGAEGLKRVNKVSLQAMRQNFRGWSPIPLPPPPPEIICFEKPHKFGPLGRA